MKSRLHETVEAVTMNADFPSLFLPFTIKNMTLRNRVCSTAHFAEWMADADGQPNADCVAYMAERARGGIGMVTTGATVTMPGAGPGYFQNLDDGFVDAYRVLAKAVHGHGAKLIAQLLHAGDQPPVIGNAPVARIRLGEYLPALPGAEGTPPAATPGSMRDWSEQGLREIVQSFAEGAGRAQAGGADGVELHAHERYLLAQFLSPFYNRRGDSYGGPLENRARLVVETLAAIRKETGDDFVVGVRLKARDFHPEGMVEEDCIQLINLLDREGLIDYVSLTAGTDQIHHGPMYLPDGGLLPMVGEIKRAVDVPVLHAGRITDPRMAERALAEGQVDLVGMTKAHIADPHLMNKLAEGRPAEIRPCVRCLHCLEMEPVNCIYNPLTGREREWSAPARAATGKRVVIVGAGPAGMEAAIAAAGWGHRVAVLEKAESIGGQILLAGAGKLRRKMLEIAEFYERQARAGRFEVRTGASADEATVMELDPEVVVIATGSRPVRPAVHGFETEKILTVRELLEGPAPAGKRVLIVDRLGGHEAFVAADVLAGAGCEVQYISPLSKVGERLGPRDGGVLYEELAGRGVGFEAGLDIGHAADDGVVLKRVATGREIDYGRFELIVFAGEEEPVNELGSLLEKLVPELRVIGAADGNPSIRSATLDGARVGMDI